ncbi:MAG: hypothetical protein ACFCGT_24650 [Sandaracinaceae bacterium]
MADPDFAGLPVATRRVIERGIAGAVRPGPELTPVQVRVLEAVGRAVLGVPVDAAHLEPASAEELAEALAEVDAAVRQRVVQLMLMLELLLHPLPEEVVEHVAAYARALHVEEGLLDVARDYAHQAYGLALKDLQRKGYFADWDHHGRIEDRLHTHKHLSEPYEVDDHDPELEARWRGLERCAPGTLGRKVWAYYRSRGFIFPGAEGSVSPMLAQHDWIHVLADYGTVVDSEVEVFGFIASAIPDPRGFSFLVAVLGLFETGTIREDAGGVLQADEHHLQRDGMAERLADALRRGRLCHRDVMTGIDYFELVDLPLDEARRRLGIVPKSAEAIRAGSVGIDDPEGITGTQRANGDPTYQPPAGASPDR